MFDVPAGLGRQLTCSPRGCCSARNTIRWRKSTRRRQSALDPKLPLAHYLLGELYLYKSRIPEAIAEFQKELAINPGHAATYYKLADAYSRIQKYEDAERLLQRSIWLDATSTGPYILMGKVLEKKGEFDLAVRALQRAATMDPNNPTTHHLLGQTYRDMGKKEEAESELKLAEELQTQAGPAVGLAPSECGGLVAATRLDFDVDIDQRHRCRRHAGNARGLPDRARLHLATAFPASRARVR